MDTVSFPEPSFNRDYYKFQPRKTYIETKSTSAKPEVMQI